MAAEWMSEKQRLQRAYVNKIMYADIKKMQKNICMIKNVFYLCNPKRKERGCKGL